MAAAGPDLGTEFGEIFSTEPADQLDNGAVFVWYRFHFECHTEPGRQRMGQSKPSNWRELARTGVAVVFGMCRTIGRRWQVRKRLLWTLVMKNRQSTIPRKSCAARTSHLELRDSLGSLRNLVVLRDRRFLAAKDLRLKSPEVPISLRAFRPYSDWHEYWCFIPAKRWRRKMQRRVKLKGEFYAYLRL